jgi:hypothetical protein
MTTVLSTIANMADITVGQSVRTQTGRTDWHVTKIVDSDYGYVVIARMTNDGRRCTVVKTRREIARGALRAVHY